LQVDAEPLWKRALAIREKALGPTILTSRGRSTAWLSFTKPKAATLTPSGSTSEREKQRCDFVDSE